MMQSKCDMFRFCGILKSATVLSGRRPVMTDGPIISRRIADTDVFFSFSQGTLKISLPYSPTKTLSVKSILR